MAQSLHRRTNPANRVLNSGAMDRRQGLIQRLADGRFHSGELLARELGISRAAVWKHLQAVGAETGLVIHAVRGRGYRLSHALELLDAERILAALPAERRGRLSGLEIHRHIDSTNTHLITRAARGAARVAATCPISPSSFGRSEALNVVTAVPGAYVR